MKTLKWISFNECLNSLFQNQQHMLLFLCLQGFVLLIAVYFYLANNKPYQSRLRVITPTISTPVPAGQKQFGSAEWLSEKEKDRVFQYFKLNKNDRYIKMLMKAGIKDYKGCEEQYEKKYPFNKKRKIKHVKKLQRKPITTPIRKTRIYKKVVSY